MQLSKHHKQIDDQTLHFSVERLREIEAAHELSIADLGELSASALSNLYLIRHGQLKRVSALPDLTRPAA